MIMQGFIDDTTPEGLRAQISLYQAGFGLVDTERAKLFGLPDGCRIREGAKILYPHQLKLGKNCWIGENAILDASGFLEIGDDCSIGLAVYVWTHDSHKLNISGSNTRDNNHKIKRKKTVIGNNCFIAGHSVIMPGVNIGDGCIIAPMSVVYKDLPAGTVYTPYRDMLKQSENYSALQDRLSDIENRLLMLEKRDL